LEGIDTGDTTYPDESFLRFGAGPTSTLTSASSTKVGGCNFERYSVAERMAGKSGFSVSERDFKKSGLV